MMITSESLWQYIESHRRVHGTLPKLRECVEHFDGKLLNVLMCLGELPDSKKAEVRQIATADRAVGRRRTGTSK